MQNALTERQVLAHLRSAIKTEGTRKFAQRAKVSPQYVRQVLNGDTPPSEKILKVVGIVRQTSYALTPPAQTETQK